MAGINQSLITFKMLWFILTTGSTMLVSKRCRHIPADSITSGNEFIQTKN